MKIIMKTLILALGMLLMSACTHVTPNVELSEQFWKTPNNQVAVAQAKKPKATFVAEGNQGGLLDMAVTEAMTKKFKKHLETHNNQFIDDINRQLITVCQSKGIKISKVDGNFDKKRLPRFKQNGKKTKGNNSNLHYATKDYRSQQMKVDSDKLLIIELHGYGAKRHYNGLIPLSEPKAFVNIEGQLIDLKDNHLLWHYKNDIKLPVQGKWDQPPLYPNFDKSLKEAIQIVSEEIVAHFSENA